MSAVVEVDESSAPSTRSSAELMSSVALLTPPQLPELSDAAAELAAASAAVLQSRTEP